VWTYIELSGAADYEERRRLIRHLATPHGLRSRPGRTLVGEPRRTCRAGRPADA
jgi:hypothetical protein